MMRTKCIYTLSIVFLNVNKVQVFYCAIHLNGKWRKIGPVKKVKNVHLNRYSQALFDTENNLLWIDLHHPMRTKYDPTLPKEKNSSKLKTPLTLCRKRAI